MKSPPPLSASQYYIWFLESLNGKMEERHTWVESTVQTSRILNVNNRQDFKQYVRLNLCDCGNAQTSNPV